MPGRSCAVVGCSANAVKCKGLSFFKVCRPENKDWENILIRAINRSDKSFRPQNAFVCSRHFEPSCFMVDPMCEFKRRLLPGSVPTIDMPARSCERQKPPPRKPPAQRDPSPDGMTCDDHDDEHYMSSPTLEMVISELREESWSVIQVDIDNLHIIQYRRMEVLRCMQMKRDLAFSSFVKGREVISGSITSMEQLVDHLHELEKLQPCEGVIDKELQDYQGNNFFREMSFHTEQHSNLRAMACTGIGPVCALCVNLRKRLNKRLKRRLVAEKRQINAKTPLRHVRKVRMAKAFSKQRRLVNKQKIKIARLERRLERKLKKESISVPQKMHKSLSDIMSDQEVSLTNPMVKLFWNEQKKNLLRPASGRRWHPMMIRLAILLHSQSPQAYRTLRESGVLSLPGESTLRDFTNYICPNAGFQLEIFQELKEDVKDLQDNEKWVTIIHDEMSIKSDLVYNERSGEIVGFVYGDGSTIATHILQFMIVGVSKPMKRCIGYFGTTTATASDLFPKMWEAIGLLELFCGLKVIASTSDKAAANMTLVELHGSAGQAENLFAEDRHVHFMSDPPHLLKTLRNNLSNSGSAKRSRYLWNNGHHLLWQHIRDVYEKDSARELKKTKLTKDHIYFTSYSAMNVRLAAEVLSDSVYRYLLAYGGEETAETAKFVHICDKFFDCLNVRSNFEGERKRKSDLMPYTSTDDPRFQYLQEVVEFFREWESNVEAREGFNKAEKQKMFISLPTYKGVVTTVESTTQAVKYLLGEGVTPVYTNRFCQDPLEAHFGKHRTMGRRSENPTLYTYGYQDTKLRIQKSVSEALRPRGNVAATYEEIEINDQPLKKRRKESMT